PEGVPRYVPTGRESKPPGGEGAVSSVASASRGSRLRCVDGGGLLCELAEDRDDDALRRLLQEAPLDGRIRLAFPREPSFFAAGAVEGRRHATVVARRGRNGPVVGMGSRSVKEVYLNGEPALLGYLGGLRLAPGWRAGRRTLAGAYALLGGLRRSDELPFDLTSVVADNLPARRLLERGVPGLPRYTPLTELVTLVVRTGPGGRRRGGSRRGRGVVVEAAGTGSRLDALAERLRREGKAHHLAPRWNRPRLDELASGRLGTWHPLVALHRGEAVGCAAVWDQRLLRQCVVRGYAPWLGRARPVLDAALRLTGRPGLPPAGAALAMGYLSHLSAADGEISAELVAAARSWAVGLGLELLAMGLPAGGPEVEVLRRRFGGRTYRSVLYAVHDPDCEPGPPLPALPGADVRVEVATL
ncbi:MAG TPA: hypothetical protein VE173_13875, partial [Longimicrobiales bacterium]|nr:hypothetical protein [Longimicrobiales bacterium]